MSLNSMLKHAVTWFFSKTPRIQHLMINEVVLGNITEGIVTTVQFFDEPRFWVFSILKQGLYALGLQFRFLKNKVKITKSAISPKSKEQTSICISNIFYVAVLRCA